MHYQNNKKKYRESMQAHYEANREALLEYKQDYYNANKGSWREQELIRRYNITFEDFQKLLKSQGFACAVCGSLDSGTREWSIDHDHKCCPTPAKSCGKCIRGILCGACNCGLGYFKDDPNRLQAAINYLENN